MTELMLRDALERVGRYRQLDGRTGSAERRLALRIARTGLLLEIEGLAAAVGYAPSGDDWRLRPDKRLGDHAWLPSLLSLRVSRRRLADIAAWLDRERWVTDVLEAMPAVGPTTRARLEDLYGSE